MKNKHILFLLSFTILIACTTNNHVKQEEKLDIINRYDSVVNNSIYHGKEYLDSIIESDVDSTSKLYARVLYLSYLKTEEFNRWNSLIKKQIFSSNNIHLKIVYNLKKGQVYNKFGDLDQAEKAFLTSISIAENQNYYELLAEGYKDLAVNYRFQDNYKQQASYLYKALRLCEIHQLENQKYQVLSELGVHNYYMNETDTAMANLTQAVEYFSDKNMNKDIGFTSSVLGLIHMKRRTFENANFYLNASLNAYSNIDDTVGIGETYNNLALLHMHQAEWEKALEQLLKGYQILENYNDDRQLPIIASNITDCYTYLGDDDNFHLWNQKSKELALKHKSRSVLLDHYQRNYNYLFKKEQWKDALSNRIQFEQLKDSINDENELTEIARLKSNYLKQVNDQEILVVRERQKRMTYTLWGSLGGGLLLALSFLIILVLRNKLIKNKLSASINKERYLKEKNKSIANELDHLTNEMRELTHQIGIKNQVINDLELNHLANIKQAKEIDLLKSKLHTNEDWKQFKTKFIKAHPLFYQKMKELPFDLTAADNRLLMLLQLKFNYSEIGDALGISVSSVRTHKYRLNKKFKSNQSDIEEFVVSN